jgi:hypothetical protein
MAATLRTIALENGEDICFKTYSSGCLSGRIGGDNLLVGAMGQGQRSAQQKDYNLSQAFQVLVHDLDIVFCLFSRYLPRSCRDTRIF